MNTAFSADHGRIRLDSQHGPAWLPLEQAERLLRVFEIVGAAKPFNDLYDALAEAREPAPKTGLRLVGAEPQDAA